jgi:hypothetical protein
MLRFNSENYQVMNYGLGGYISMHMDAYPDSNSINIGMTVRCCFITMDSEMAASQNSA